MRARLRLRPHHLVCLQHFRGAAYTPGMAERVAAIAARCRQEPAGVTEGPDDVCRACPHLGADRRCGNAAAGGEAGVRRLDALALAVLDVSPGDRLSLADARRRLQSAPEAVRLWRTRACAGCTWERLCEEGWGSLAG